MKKITWRENVEVRSYKYLFIEASVDNLERNNAEFQKN
jgi:hypothetical protein